MSEVKRGRGRPPVYSEAACARFHRAVEKHGLTGAQRVLQQLAKNAIAAGKRLNGFTPESLALLATISLPTLRKNAKDVTLNMGRPYEYDYKVLVGDKYVAADRHYKPLKAA